ncbi:MULTISPECIES: PH domain-containing protein [unclassified Pseudactinotalea]|uniref:PH domain-containing protein n=1 Tax=unclassified Pseudactinotalea TaxID=2649176 RepID=UPI00128E289D|nr:MULTISPECIES: PH domain-containing protein [unclassified Pseudactinotalea]MPV48431.1 PH domain-containing protein [Pseudactinotalea sp. HY160]QGH68410.1 PH domain-containing protein [Pseudactinotalea sp. HY158]
MTSSPFDLDGATWVSVSRRLITVRVWICLISLGIPLLAGIVLGVVFGGWLWIVPGVIALLLAWLLWLVPRQVPAIGYAELDDELAIRKGIMFRTLTLVPYGRMQYIEVDAGPVAHKNGIATITLHTASASSDAEIPGVPEAEASRLRDRLTRRSESMLAGL